MIRCTILLLMVWLQLPALEAELATLREQHREVADLLQRSYVFVASGSGVLISSDGLILSNHHVTAESPDHRVRLANGASYQARVIGTDPYGDISLLRIEDPPTEGLPHVELGEAKDLVVGRPVLAVGNPFGLGDTDDHPTVTRGRLGSSRIVRGVYTDAIQVDAAVNPGNSGGPSLSLDGRLLGINGQIRTRTGMRINSGVGLAIACTQLRAFLPLLQSTASGYVHHTAIPKGLELEHRAGSVVVKHWKPEDAAQQDLLNPGERLVAVDDRPVISLDTAHGLLASLPWTGPEVTIPVTVQAIDGATPPRRIQLPAGRTTIPGKPWHGLEVSAKNVQHDGANRKRMVIVQVDPGSPAATAGVTAGWIIEEANGRSLGNRLDLLKALVPLEIGDRLELVCQDPSSGTGHRLGFWLRPKP